MIYPSGPVDFVLLLYPSPTRMGLRGPRPTALARKARREPLPLTYQS